MNEDAANPHRPPLGEFVSEPITPDPGTFQASAMARGEHGLPSGFRWRGRHYTIRELLDDWKFSEPWNHAASGSLYYRKHYFRVRTDTGETMTLYAVRNVKRGENPRKRWWLYAIEQAKEKDC